MSIITSNCDQICNSPTNDSKAKMLYSFPKSPRFAKERQVLCDNFYENSKTSNKRTTSLGYGKKYDFTKDFPQTPAPGSYQHENVFEDSKKRNKGFGFGTGRGEMEVTGITPKNSNPGPGKYQIPSTKTNVTFSLKGKIKIQDKQQIYVPGPGTYNCPSTFSKTGINHLGKHKTKSACRFGREEKLKIQNLKVPGPGSYQTSKSQLSPNGKYILSRMESAKARTFGKGIRKSFDNRCQTPGPGNYRLPSDFGYYIDKTAFNRMI